MYKTFCGVLAEAARWLTGLGVTHVAMEATGVIYSMPVYHALVFTFSEDYCHVSA
jgi:hypothetical protein